MFRFRRHDKNLFIQNDGGTGWDLVTSPPMYLPSKRKRRRCCCSVGASAESRCLKNSITRRSACLRGTVGIAVTGVLTV